MCNVAREGLVEKSMRRFLVSRLAVNLGVNLL